MEDEKIIALYNERSEWAITETESKYGRYCYGIDQNILNSRQDSEECVSDTWLRAWNTIPPEQPSVLSAYLGRITRNLAIDRYRASKNSKRNVCFEEIMSETAELIPSDEADIADTLALSEAINGFLATLTKSRRIIFVRRYWYAMSVKEIAQLQGMNEGNVKVILLRTREKLMEYLEREGITV